jgi:uncharacterized protein
MRRSIALLLALLALASCAPGSGDAEGGSGAASPSPSFGAGTVIIDKGKDTVLLSVEIAQTAEQRRVGLMRRRSLENDRGMVFVFFEPTDGGFWMKDTTIPLSIAFFGRNGVVKRILDMDPCLEDDCKIYSPGVAYWGALEVNQGAFAHWGVTTGDVIRIAQ